MVEFDSVLKQKENAELKTRVCVIQVNLISFVPPWLSSSLRFYPYVDFISFVSRMIKSAQSWRLNSVLIAVTLISYAAYIYLQQQITYAYF